MFCFSRIYSKTDVDQLWRENPTADYLAVVVERFNDTFLGPQILLDFYNERTKIALKITTNKHSLTQIHNLAKFPGLIIFKKNNPVPFFISKYVGGGGKCLLN